MKFLIIRFSSIGDIVLTTPVVRCLKKKFPEAEIHFATKKSFQSILLPNPYITRVHVLNGSLWQLVSELRNEGFDYVIDLHNNQRTFVLKTLLGVKSVSFNKLNLQKWLLVNFKIDRMPHKHIVDRYIETCSSLGVVNDGEGLDYFMPAGDEVDIATLPAGFKNGYIGWAIGAKQHTKQMPTSKVIETIKMLHLPIVLLGGSEDAANAEHICNSVTSVPVYNACGKYSLNQSASLVRQCLLLVTNDTGLMHIGAAFKKRIVSVWGNTVPQFGMYPYYGKTQNDGKPAALNEKWYKVEVEGLPCRPCSKLGYGQCPQRHFNCMNNISETEIAQLVASVSEKV